MCESARVFKNERLQRLAIGRALVLIQVEEIQRQKRDQIGGMAIRRLLVLIQARARTCVREDPFPKSPFYCS